MKLLKGITILLFCVVLVLPLIFFNFEEESISVIDNRLLASNPFDNDLQGDFTTRIENYVNDRIGFRDKMIWGYTVLNDRVFNKMVHPIYTYGKKGYVFGGGITSSGLFSDYHIAFADMIAQQQAYCEDRGIPFLFVFNPAKPAVYSEYLAEGIAYSRDWVDLFFVELDKRGVNYLDNTVTMIEAKNAGETVFNKKYDANHWNSTGAYYGTNAILKKLNERIAELHINNSSEFIWGEETMFSLPVSNFPINESVPKVKLTYQTLDNTNKYRDELVLHPSYQAFGSFVNEQRKSEHAPSALVFQGSYMNNLGKPYLVNAFGEYTMIHDYQNVVDLPYYFNIFKPDCVIFEVAEYTFSEKYFSYKAMKNIDYNKTLSSYAEEEITLQDASDVLVVEKGKALTKLAWNTDLNNCDVWLVLDREYDMKKNETGYEVTVKTEVYEAHTQALKIATRAETK